MENIKYYIKTYIGRKWKTKKLNRKLMSSA